MGREDSERQLAEAMTKLANALEHVQDPVLWQKVFRDAMREGIVSPLQVQVTPVPLPASPVGMGQVQAITLTLSTEERERLASSVYKALQPQLTEFSAFVQQALKDMPPHRLKEIADGLAQGKKPQLDRRSGCVFITLGPGEDYYLGL